MIKLESVAVVIFHTEVPPPLRLTPKKRYPVLSCNLAASDDGTSVLVTIINDKRKKVTIDLVIDDKDVEYRDAKDLLVM